MQEATVDATDREALEALEALEKLGPREKWRIVKNIAVLGFAFMVHFTAFHGTSNLQSSLHNDGSLGAYTLACIYGSLILSNLFLPVLVIRHLGCKWTIVVSFVAYMPYIAAQFYPSFATLIPSGLAVGFGGGPLWCAKCTYLSIIAEAFSVATRRKVRTEYLIVKFFSLFFVFYQLAQVLGNLISFTVLSYGSDSGPVNGTIERSGVNVSITCGAQYEAPIHQAAHAALDLKRPEPEQLNRLTGIFLACMVAASVSVALGVDSLQRYNMVRKSPTTNGASGMNTLAVTVRQLRHKYQLLLLPIVSFIGIEQAFITADFTKSFVACGLGISYIGYAMISFGLANTVAAALTPYVTKHLGRRLLILLTFLFHAALIVFMLLWKPTDRYYQYSIIVACWGLADGVWLIQINSLSGILFPGNEEAAFSNFRLWEACGSVIMYSASSFFPTFHKLLFVLGMMIVGTIGYGTIELMEHRAKRIDSSKRFEAVSQEPYEN